MFILNALALTPILIPAIPAEASHAVMSMFQARNTTYTASATTIISARFSNSGRVCA